MKKALSVVLLLAVILTAGACGIFKPSPKKALLGKWDYTADLGDSSLTFGSLEFKEDGVMSAKLVSLITVDGTYEITKNDDGVNILSITYKALGISHTAEYTFEIDDTSLKLTPVKLSDITLTYTKAE
ncbi:MAG: hypothetical protein K5756_03540 [Clostridiales bacterium]|nr:hypothetical protein [Clostridiales bacterium]